MRQSLLLLFLLAFVLPLLAQDINVMTFNVRYNNPGDSLNAWPNRKDNAVSQVLFHKVHLLGVQEALFDQMEDLKRGLEHFKYVGVGRADGKQKGEYSAIFYDTLRLELLGGATFWLAEKTDEPGRKGWDAAIERIVTWAHFRDRQTGKSFYHFNTHFDHIGKTARRESAALLLRKVKEIAGTAPVIVTGDFNAQPADEPIRVITDASNPDHLTDSKAISKQAHYGPTGTFNGFGPKEVNDQPIDYIFVKNAVRVSRHATISETWEGRFSSDHFPVLAELGL